MKWLCAALFFTLHSSLPVTTMTTTMANYLNATFQPNIGVADNFSLQNLYKIGKVDYVEDGQQSRLWFLGQ